MFLFSFLNLTRPVGHYWHKMKLKIEPKETFDFNDSEFKILLPFKSITQSEVITIIQLVC